MRLPYLKLFIDDSRRHGATLAALDPQKRDARWWRGLLEDVWDYGVKVSGDKRPDGIIMGQDADVLVSSCVGYAGPAEELSRLLARAGLLERLPDDEGVRIKGVEELYGTAWDAQEAEKKRKAEWRAKNATRTGRGQDADVHPQDGDGDKDGDGDLSKEAAAPLTPVTEPVKSHPTIVTPPTTDSVAWLGEDFWRWAEARRQHSKLPPQKPPHPRKLSEWWNAVRLVESDVERVKEAFLNFGDDKHWQQQKPPLPFGGFMSQWSNYLPFGRRNAS